MDPISTRIALGAAGQGGEEFWILELSSGTGEERAEGVVVDDDGNSYMCGAVESGGISNAFLIKVDIDGAVLFQKGNRPSDSNQNAFYSICKKDSIIYCVGQFSEPSNYAYYVVRYNTNGSIIWDKKITPCDFFDRLYGCDIDNSNNLHALGKDANYWYHLKYNSSGTLLWQRLTGSSSSLSLAEDLAVNPTNGTVYCVGDIVQNRAVLRQIFGSSSTTPSGGFERTIGASSSENEAFFGVKVDASGDVYVAGRDDSSGNAKALIMKFNSSGTVQWQRTLDGSSYQGWDCLAVEYDTKESYVAGKSSTTSGIILAKYSSSGTLEWQREIEHSSETLYVYSIAISSTGALHLVGQKGQSSYDVLNIKIPEDGSLLGTYGSYTYSAISFTDAAANETITNDTVSLLEPGNTSANISPITSNLSLTSSLIDLS